MQTDRDSKRSQRSVFMKTSSPVWHSLATFDRPGITTPGKMPRRVSSGQVCVCVENSRGYAMLSLPLCCWSIRTTVLWWWDFCKRAGDKQAGSADQRSIYLEKPLWQTLEGTSTQQRKSTTPSLSISIPLWHTDSSWKGNLRPRIKEGKKKRS